MPTDIALEETVTRSQLYDLVWAHETKILANRLGISGSLVGRVCRRWLIPKPGRGDWQQMQAGQIIARPKLAATPTDEANPVVLELRADGRYGTRVPRKARTPRPKQDALADYFEKQRVEQQREQEKRDREQTKLFELVSGPACRHLFVIERWQAAYDINMALHPALSFEDTPAVHLECRYLLPERRRGQRMAIELRFRLQRADALSGPLSDDLGNVHFRKRSAYLDLAQDKSAMVCAALAGGMLRIIDLEAVKDTGGYETIRQAQLRSRTYDGAEDHVSA